MSTRIKIQQRLAGADEAELQRLRRLYANDREALAAIEDKLNPEPTKRAARRTTPK